MKYPVLGVFGAAALAAFPTAAFAQGQTLEAEPFVGVSGGYHDLGIDDDDLATIGGIEIDDGSPILGVVAGVDFPLSERVFAGIEGNFHFGTDVIDTEYGASLRLGVMASSGSKFYVRGGYQEVDFDVDEFVDIDIDDDLFDGFDTSDGDYLVGAGADIPVGPGALRLNVDTISFDTVRATTGYVLKF
jgi:hypothetical protein